MQNKHLHHPEDLVLEGDLSALDIFIDPDAIIGCKIDGSPAIVWGTDPATGTFFVGTKSVFNKVKIKINHSHDEIDLNHSGEVATILHSLFDNLPRTDSIIQGDFIGFGGCNRYQPNTIEYVFPQVLHENVIVAPHTQYKSETTLRGAVASPLQSKLNHTNSCRFIQPECSIHSYREDFEPICNFARQMSTLCKFEDSKGAAKIRKYINSKIRAGVLNTMKDDETAKDLDVDINLIRLWKLVLSMKIDLFMFIAEPEHVSDPDCYIDGELSFHEGYVLTSKYGSIKLVDRELFSRSNFLKGGHK